MTVRHLRLIEKPGAEASQAPSLRIAIATQDMKALNAHFGSARKFAIYDVSAETWSFVEAVAFDSVSAETGQHKEDGDDRITPKVDALAGVKLLFVRAIGGPAAAKVVRAGIHPIKIADPQPIESVIERVQGMLKTNPPPWLRKVLADAGPTKKASFAEENA
ncbi:MAG: nitrogen fixation protein NifX [Hyphomicrobiales bacterium]|nr:MAG: nitrogen fixation protein NifX [Hyphomicrobiales bacterium]